MNKKNLVLWSLYDFANSIIFVTFVLYFAQWLVIDGGLSDFWYNAIFAIATVLLLVSAPALASYTDRKGGRKLFLNITTVATAICYGLAVVVAHMGTSYVVLAAILFLLGQYFYQFSFVFYDAMIEDVAEPSRRARASGIGYFFNSLGQFAGVALSFLFASSRLASLGPSVIVFFALSLPMMMFFKESRVFTERVRLSELKDDTKIFFKKFAVFFSTSVAVPMLLAFFFFNDAILTLTNNYSIVLERVFAVSDHQKSLLFMAIIVMSGLGGVLSGWLADRIGMLKTLKRILFAWIIALPLLAIAPTFTLFAALTIPVGLLLGSVFSVSRAYMSTLLPKEELAYGFSFYTLAERFATFAGPLTWGLVIFFGHRSVSSYRFAVASMVLFIIIGFLILVHFRKRSDDGLRAS